MKKKQASGLQPLMNGEYKYPIAYIDQSTETDYQFMYYSIAEGHRKLLFISTLKSKQDLLRFENNPALSCFSVYFKDVKCATCTSEFEAISMSKTELGPVCEFCLKESEPRLPFVLLDNIEKYLSKSVKYLKGAAR